MCLECRDQEWEKELEQTSLGHYSAAFLTLLLNCAKLHPIRDDLMFMLSEITDQDFLDITQRHGVPVQRQKDSIRWVKLQTQRRPA